MLRVLSFLCGLLVSASALAGGLETPPLRVMPFSKLQFPPQLSKVELTWMVQRSADDLSGFAFSDLGDFTDFMHGHVLFKPLDGSERPEKELTDPSWTPNWSQLEAVGVLIHTQEYSHIRKGEPYMGPNGPLLTANRNWVFWLKDTEKGLRGSLTPATQLMENIPTQPIMTVYSGDLLPSIFGSKPGRWEYSVYFFKVRCDLVESQVSADVLLESNVTTVQWKGQKTCLLLQSYNCRNHPEDTARCGGLEIPPDTRFK